MKKVAFTCSKCKTLNIPRAQDRWKGFAACRVCGSIQPVAARGEERTSRQKYRDFALGSGLPISMIIEIQKRGLLPRDLATCSALQRDIACAIKLILGSEEILRGALASIPEKRRLQLLHVVDSDALLIPWQRYVLDRYIGEYKQEIHSNPQGPSGEKRRGYGNAITSNSAMILHLEQRYGLPAVTSHPWIKRLKRIARARVQRGKKKALLLEGTDHD